MAYSEENFFQDYLFIKPKEAGFRDLFLLLSSSHLEKRGFIECPLGHGNNRNFRRRWLIFISVIAQKIFLFMREPMASAGRHLEMWLNLLAINGGLFKLLFNFLRGKMVKPDRSSAKFTSIVGNTDRRIELDTNIEPRSIKYYASMSIMAAKLAYENENFIKTVVNDHWKMEFLCFYNFWNDYQNRRSTQTFVFQDTTLDPNVIVVGFRGTHPFDALAWCTDVDISWYKLHQLGKVHGGFMKALGLQVNQGWPKDIDPRSDDRQFAYYAIRQMLKDMLQKNKKAKFIVTGHSLGGALAILFVAVLVLHEEAWLLDRLEGVYTFGQPRVGDEQFGEFMMEKLKKYEVHYWRFVYCNDMVVRLPFDDKTLMFKHFGLCLYYDSFYRGKVLRDEPNKNYFSLLWVVPKYVNAFFELIRAFILPYIKGADYREGWFMKTVRLMGLLIPGLSAHICQDYNNAIRLGDSLPSPL